MTLCSRQKMVITTGCEKVNRHICKVSIKNVPSVFAILCFHLIAGSFLSVHAQTKELDSLISRLSNKTLDDSARYTTLSAISWAYLDVSPDSSLAVAKRTVAWAQKLKKEAWEANALNTLGAVFYMKSNYQEAKKYYLLSAAIKRKRGDDRSLAKTLNNLGLLAQDQGNC